MREENEIILSFYYENPYHDPAAIKNDQFTMMMDLRELLLIEDDVFKERRYSFDIREGKMDIWCLPYDDEYEKEFGNEQETIRELDGLLRIDLKGRHAYLTQKQFRKLKDKEKMELLYYDSVLVNVINSSHCFSERNTFQNFRIYGASGGGIYCAALVNAVKELVDTYISNGKAPAQEVLSAVNEDYIALNRLYKNSEDVLNELIRKKELFRPYYLSNNNDNKYVNCILNGDSIFYSKKMNAGKDVIEYVAGDPSVFVSSKKRIYELLWQIIGLGTYLGLEGCTTLAQNINLPNKSDICATNVKFRCLHKKLDELKEKNSENFDWEEWREDYYKLLDQTFVDYLVKQIT